MPVRTLRKPLPRIRVENVGPQLDCGQFPAKRTVGERVDVSATVIRDGHDILGAAVLYREPGKRRFQSPPREPIGNDVFAGSFTVTSCGRWEYLVEAWSDRTATWRDELRRKVEAGQEDLAGELAEGEQLLGIPQLDVETALASTASDRQGATRSGPYTPDVH